MREARESAELAPHSLQAFGSILPQSPNDSFRIADTSTTSTELYTSFSAV